MEGLPTHRTIGVGALLVYVQTSMGFVGIGSQGNRDVWLRWSAGTLAHLRALDEHPTLLAASLAGSRTDASGLPAHEVAFEGVSFRYLGLPSRDSLTFPLRQRLLQALDDLDRPWTAGPYSDAARLLLRGRTGAIRDMFDRCEELADVVRGSDVPWVITHGQLHEANIVLDADDDLYFVDLETLNVAPRERDTIWAGWSCR